MVIGLESSGSRMANLARQQMYFGRFFDIDEIEAEIEAVTSAAYSIPCPAALPPGGDRPHPARQPWHHEDRARESGLLTRMLIKFVENKTVLQNAAVERNPRGTMTKIIRTMDLHDLQRETRHEAGFTLIELLIVMSVMLVLMTLAVPQYLKVRKTAQETSAIESIHNLVAAELSYSAAYPANGFTCTISQLGGDPKSGAPSNQSAQLIDSALATGQKSGYTFAITNCNKVTVNNQDMFTSFEVTAVPQSVGKSGDNGFCSDESSTIRKDPTGGTNCTVPMQ